MIRIYIYLAIVLSVFSCQRKPLEELSVRHTVALIPVKIDWSESGIHVDRESNNIGDEDYVQKVSFRFFPTDGSRPFEYYLEGQTKEDGSSIYGGIIPVPIGEYDILAMNESVLEEKMYWSEYYIFKNIDSYASISAQTLAKSYDFTQPPYDFYAPYKLPDEQFQVPARKIASWRMDKFDVTEDLVRRSHSAQTPAEVDSLTLDVLMRQLFVNINLSVEVENIKSLYKMRGVIKSLSTSKNLTTAVRGEEASSIMFQFDNKKIVSGESSTGTKKHTVRSFGPHIFADPNEKYLLYLDVIMVDGKRYEGQDMVFDITKELKEGIDDLEIDVELPLLKLPVATVDPSLDDWEDDDVEGNTDGAELTVSHSEVVVRAGESVNIYYSTDAAEVTPTVEDNDHIKVFHVPGKITLTADNDIPVPSVAILTIQADHTIKQIRVNIK